uniref:Arrestin C-terminal-like domain-containing protein n=1 Tax=Panagrolaimus davidi TaxID=227884 RepID=A0A914Q3X5_9BILA
MCVGRGYSTFWKEKRCKTNELELYKSDVTYLKIEQILWKPKNFEEKLPIGESRFLFSIELPSDLPPSFEGRNGHIRYKLKAEITVPWGFDKTAEQRFLIGPIVDFVAKPNLGKKVEIIVGKNSNSDLKVKLSCPKIAYFLDESILLTAEITNNSQLPYIGKRKYTFERTIPIPTLMPTIAKCNIITVQYSIYVALYTGTSMSFTTTGSYPILISNQLKNPIIPHKKDSSTVAPFANFHEIGKSNIKSSGALTTLVRNATKNTIDTSQLTID